MNVFLDSNILFEDYFFENKSNAQILDYCQRGLLKIYTSQIVVLELRRQYEKEINIQLKEINKLKDDAQRLKIKVNYQDLSLEVQLKIFDKFFEDMQDFDNFVVLDYKNDYLPKIVDRAIYRKKPFTEEKSELKDAIIWVTYADFVESNKTEDCILLTNNTSDFCTKKVKNKVHPELEKDTERFSVINSSWEFIKIYSPKLESPEHKFHSYIGKFSFTDKYVTKLIDENFSETIRKKIHDKLDYLNISDILNKEYFFDGQLVGYDVEILDTDNIETEIIYDKLLISGVVTVNCEIEVMEYNSSRDPGEDSFTVTDEKDLQFSVYFNFDFRKGEIADEFEVTGIEFEQEV